MRRSVLPQRDVGDLMRKAVRALIDLLIDDQTRTDAGGYGHELHIMIILSSSDDRFGQTGEVGVVFEIDRQSGRFAQLFADGVIPPLLAEVGRRQDIAVQQVERSGTGNADALCALAEAVHDAGKNVMAYTGFTFEELLDKAQSNPDVARLLELVDTLVDGPYIEALRDLELKFRGSSNQRLLDREQRALLAARHAAAVPSA